MSNYIPYAIALLSAGCSVLLAVYAWLVRKRALRAESALEDQSRNGPRDITAVVEEAVAAEREALQKEHRRTTVATARLLSGREMTRRKAEEERRLRSRLRELEQQAVMLGRAKKWQETLVPLGQLVALVRLSGDRRSEAVHLQNQAKVHCVLGQFEAASHLLKQALDAATAAVEADDPLLESIRNRLQQAEDAAVSKHIDSLLRRARLREVDCPEFAISSYSAASQYAHAHDRPLDQCRAISNSYRAYSNADKLEEGCAALSKGLALARSLFGDDAHITEALDRNLHFLEGRLKSREFDRLLARSRDLQRSKKFEEAEEFADMAVTEAARALGPRDWRVAVALDNLGMLMLRGGRTWDAESVLERSEDLALEYEHQRPQLLKDILAHLAVCREHM